MSFVLGATHGVKEKCTAAVLLRVMTRPNRLNCECSQGVQVCFGPYPCNRCTTGLAICAGEEVLVKNTYVQDFDPFLELPALWDLIHSEGQHCHPCHEHKHHCHVQVHDVQVHVILLQAEPARRRARWMKSTQNEQGT